MNIQFIWFIIAWVLITVFCSYVGFFIAWNKGYRYGWNYGYKIGKACEHKKEDKNV